MICAAVTVSGCTSKQRYQQIETEFYNQQIKFSARIEKPEGSGPFPAVVIVHGSQNHRKDYYNEYSHYFAENGIVALSYDDRGFADSGGNLWTSDFLDLATDLLAAVSYLKSLGYVDEQRIGFWADSHGGWIVLIADSLSQEIAFIVNKSGPAVTPLATVLFEKSKRLDSYDLPKVTHDKILDLYQKMIEYLAGNRSETLLS
ncbi:MAG: alpha/beta hydrolase, partial [Calditrichaeota bacterium]|nr:alpha/beta hydrolase [Calditrichota bacterium]